MNTHYQVLEVPEQASASDIRQAYRRLVLLTHPDRTTDPTAHERYLAINRAYEILSVPSKRQFYDAQLWALRNPPPVAPAPVSLHPDPALRRRGQPWPPVPPVARPSQPLYVRYADEFRRLLPYVRTLGYAGVLLSLLLALDLTYTRVYPHDIVEQFDYIPNVGRRGGESYFRVHSVHANFRVENTTKLEIGDTLNVRRSILFRQIRRVLVRSGQLAGSTLHPPGVFNSFPALIGILGLISAVVFWPGLRADHQFNVACGCAFVLLITLFMLILY